MNRILLFWTMTGALLTQGHCLAESTVFTYQGRLSANGLPANGLYDFRFAIYRLETNGLLIGGPLTNTAVGVTNGLFTTSLDFGHTPFLSDNHWMDCAVRSNGSAGSFTTLSPRIRIAAAPYAIAAANIVNGGVTASSLSPGPGIDGQVLQMTNGVLTWANLGTGGTVTSVSSGSGLRGGPITGAGILSIDPAVVPCLTSNQVFTGANTFNNPANTFLGNGAGLTSLSADNLVSGTVPDARLSGNVAMLNGSQVFSGTESGSASIRVTGPGTNNWLLLSNGAVWIPPFAQPTEELGGDGQRGGIYFGSAGDTGPNPWNNQYILNKSHSTGPIPGQLLLSHQSIALEEATFGEIALGNDGDEAGLIRIRYDDMFGTNLKLGQPGHSHPLVFQARNKSNDGFVHNSYPSIIAFHGSGSDIFPADPLYNYGISAAGVLAFYTASPWPGSGSTLSGGLEMGRMETNGWNFRGTMTYQKSSSAINSGSNYVLDFGTNNYIEINLNTSPVKFSTINPHGGSNNVQSLNLILHAGSSARNVAFPAWKVLSPTGTVSAPTNLPALSTTVVRLEILGVGGDANTLARFESYLQ
jgi:hypothetical protein